MAAGGLKTETDRKTRAALAVFLRKRRLARSPPSPGAATIRYFTLPLNVTDALPLLPP